MGNDKKISDLCANELKRLLYIEYLKIPENKLTENDKNLMMALWNDPYIKNYNA